VIFQQTIETMFDYQRVMYDGNWTNDYTPLVNIFTITNYQPTFAIITASQISRKPYQFWETITKNKIKTIDKKPSPSHHHT